MRAQLEKRGVLGASEITGVIHYMCCEMGLRA